MKYGGRRYDDCRGYGVVQAIDWEFVTSVFKIRKKNYEIFKIRKNPYKFIL